MKKLPVVLKSECSLLTLALAGFFCASPPVSAQSAPAQSTNPAQDRNRNDITSGELQSFDNFLDQHREISEQLHKNPSLVNDEQFLKDHPALRDYLQNHPGVREGIRENPNVFMHAENRFDRREDAQDRDRNRNDITRGELLSFDNFLDQHREISEQLHKNPSLVNDPQFLKDHPALQDYLQNHSGVREEIRENPDVFMHAENRFDRRENAQDRNRNDITRGELQSFDNFLDQHCEISEQLHKNPSLVNDPQFLKNHPALNDYLQNHSGVREEIRENPDVFMHAENRFDRREDDLDRDRGTRDVDRDDQERSHMHRDFAAFLHSHSELAEQLSRNPEQVKSEEFLKSHPELKEYLNAHPQDRQVLMANPQSFIKSSQQFANTDSQKPPSAKPKPNQ